MAATGSFGYCDPDEVGQQQGLSIELRQQRTYGYGFSYVYRRQAALSHPFNDVNMGEDFSFFWDLHCNSDGGVTMVRDEVGICLHTQHGHNTSQADCVLSRE